MSSTPTVAFIIPTTNLTMTALYAMPPTNTAGPQATATQSAPSATYTTAAPNCTNLAQFVSETVPDLTYYAPNATFIKTWTLKNIGTCTWGSGYALVFDTGDQMGGAASTPMTASVPPNALYVFTVNLTAPATSGTFTGYWKIQTPQGVRFGIEPNGTKAVTVKITTVPPAPACTAKSERPNTNGPMIEAYYTTTPPVIDNNLVDWPATLSWKAIYDVYGSVGDSSDISGTFHLKWDSSYLYLAVRVTDNVFVQETSGRENLFKGDSIDILLDTNLQGDYCNAALTGDDYQLGISPGYLQNPALQAPSAWLWEPSSSAGAKPVVDITAHLTGTNGNYEIEARIPWSVFDMVAPSGSEKYGFAFSISDNDVAATTQQQGMVSSDPKRVRTNPMTWGTLQIEIEAGP
jgi:Ig-like domain from next to BRCA1 gene/Carbohydrate family 9 binding domain-like